MGRLIISNNEKKVSFLEKMNSENGFFESGKYKRNICVTAYKKLNTDNINYIEVNGDFAACAGTLIYKGKYDKEALEQIYRDVDFNDIAMLRKYLMGSYVLAVRKENVVKIFVDETGTYAFYYYCDEKDYLLTNTYYHIQKCFEQKINRDGFIEKVIENGILNNETPFCGIYRLGG